MGAYNDMDIAAAGMIYGLDSNCVTRAALEETAFGLPVFGYVGDGEVACGYKLDVAKMVWDADFIASNSIVVTVNGVAAGAVVFATNQATTLAAVVASVNALDGVECILEGTARTILIRTKGVTCVSTAVITGGASQADETVTTGSGQVFLGISRSTQKEDDFYNAAEPMNIIHKDGMVWSQVDGTVQAEGKAYLDITTGKFKATGVDVGCFFTTNNTGDIAVVEVAENKLMTYAESF